MTQSEMQATQLEIMCDIYSQQKALFKAICLVLGKRHEWYSYLTMNTTALDRKMIMETGNDRDDKVLHLLIENASMIHGVAAIAIDAIAHNEYQADELRNTVERISREDYQSTMDRLWADKGQLDLNEIL